MEGIEFFTSPEGQVYYRKDGHDAKRLTKFSSDIVSKVVTLVRNRFPECYSRLAILYKKNASQMVDRFVRCNFGEHDLDEHIICKPKSLVRLSKGEQEVVKLYLNGSTLDHIADQLHKNRNTVKSQLLRVRDKLGVKNCREIIRVMRMGGYML